MAPAIIQMEPYRSFGVADKLLLGADLIEVGIGGQADSYLVVEASEDHPDFKIALDEVALILGFVSIQNPILRLKMEILQPPILVVQCLHSGKDIQASSILFIAPMTLLYFCRLLLIAEQRLEFIGGRYVCHQIEFLRGGARRGGHPVLPRISLKCGERQYRDD